MPACLLNVGNTTVAVPPKMARQVPNKKGQINSQVLNKIAVLHFGMDFSKSYKWGFSIKRQIRHVKNVTEKHAVSKNRHLPA